MKWWFAGVNQVCPFPQSRLSVTLLHSLPLRAEDKCPDLPVFLLPYLWFATSVIVSVIGIKSPIKVLFMMYGQVMLWVSPRAPILPSLTIPFLSWYFWEHKDDPACCTLSIEKPVKYYLVSYSGRIHFRWEWMPSLCGVKSILHGLAKNWPFTAKFSFTLFGAMCINATALH